MLFTMFRSFIAYLLSVAICLPMGYLIIAEPILGTSIVLIPFAINFKMYFEEILNKKLKKGDI